MKSILSKMKYTMDLKEKILYHYSLFSVFSLIVLAVVSIVYLFVWHPTIFKYSEKVSIELDIAVLGILYFFVVVFLILSFDVYELEIKERKDYPYLGTSVYCQKPIGYSLVKSEIYKANTIVALSFIFILFIFNARLHTPLTIERLKQLNGDCIETILETKMLIKGKNPTPIECIRAFDLKEQQYAEKENSVIRNKIKQIKKQGSKNVK